MWLRWLWNNLGSVQSARSAIQVCQLFRSIIELLGNRALNDPMHLRHTKWNYGVDFQTHSKLEGSERIAEYRGIPVGSNIPPSQIKSVSHCNISSLDRHVGVKQHMFYFMLCLQEVSGIHNIPPFPLLIITTKTTTTIYIYGNWTETESVCTINSVCYCYVFNACPTLKINYRSSFTGFLTCLPLRVVYKVEPLVAATSGEGGIFLAGLFLVTDWSGW